MTQATTAKVRGDFDGQKPLLEVRGIVKHFPVRGGVFNGVVGHVHAVNGVSLQVRKGETVGIVGESGCGKSTLGKLIIRLIEPGSKDDIAGALAQRRESLFWRIALLTVRTLGFWNAKLRQARIGPYVNKAGSIRFDGVDITSLRHDQMMPYRRRMQMIFQDPYSSLNPRLTVRAMLREAINFHKVVPGGTAAVDAFIDQLIAKVGLRRDAAEKFPHEFSGGQRQRLGIARALALKPELIVADEPVSALDVSIQAQVLNLMMDLKDELGLTLVFVSHDLKVIEHFCDRVVVMYLGHVVEELPCDDLHERAKHPYTRALLGSNPIDDPDERRPLTVLQGDVPSPFNPPKGCPFAGRCPLVMERCRHEMPPLDYKGGPDQRVACWAVESPAAVAD